MMVDIVRKYKPGLILVSIVIVNPMMFIASKLSKVPYTDLETVLIFLIFIISCGVSSGMFTNYRDLIELSNDTIKSSKDCLEKNICKAQKTSSISLEKLYQQYDVDPNRVPLSLEAFREYLMSDAGGESDYRTQGGDMNKVTLINTKAKILDCLYAKL